MAVTSSIRWLKIVFGKINGRSAAVMSTTSPRIELWKRQDFVLTIKFYVSLFSNGLIQSLCCKSTDTLVRSWVGVEEKLARPAQQELMIISRQEPSQFTITVRKRKFDNSIKSEWEGEFLPVQFPSWMLVLHHPERHLKLSQAGIVQSDRLFLHCFSLVHPLTILFVYSPEGVFREAKCDAALPATQKGNLIEFTDLDLDLIVNPDFSYYFRDEDQFAENKQKMGYSETVVAQARTGMGLAESLVNSRNFPFDTSFMPRLKLAANL